MVLPSSHRISRVPCYSNEVGCLIGFRLQDLLPSMVYFSKYIRLTYQRLLLRALPRSLAATRGIDVSFFSSGYLDVSVHLVSLLLAMYSLIDT